MTTTATQCVWRPLGDRIFVRREEAKVKSDGGLLLPEGSRTKPLRGVVLSKGFGRQLDDGSLSEMPVKVGDVVLFTSYAGLEMSKEDAFGIEGLISMRLEDVLAVLE